jgi:anti-anti-sigma factor
MADPHSYEAPLPGQLVIDAERHDDQVVLSLSGELDLASAPILQQELEDISSTGVSRVLIDLGNLGFIDSTGLQALVRAQDRLTAEGKQLVLRRGSHQVQRVFELTKAIDAFTFDS